MSTWSVCERASGVFARKHCSSFSTEAPTFPRRLSPRETATLGQASRNSDTEKSASTFRSLTRKFNLPRYAGWGDFLTSPGFSKSTEPR